MAIRASLLQLAAQPSNASANKLMAPILERSDLAAAVRELNAPLQAALARLREEAPQLWDRRMAELAYLANLLLADARPGELEPKQALERASAICNAGLVAQLPAEQPESSLPDALALLRAISADRLFRAGYLKYA